MVLYICNIGLFRIFLNNVDILSKSYICDCMLVYILIVHLISHLFFRLKLGQKKQKSSKSKNPKKFKIQKCKWNPKTHLCITHKTKRAPRIQIQNYFGGLPKQPPFIFFFKLRLCILPLTNQILIVDYISLLMLKPRLNHEPMLMRQRESVLHHLPIFHRID